MSDERPPQYFSSTAKPPPRRRPQPDALALTNILPQVVRDLNLEQKAHDMAVLSLWPVVVPADLKPYTRALRLERSKSKITLWVAASSSAAASRLTFVQHQILVQLNTYAPQTGITLSELRITP
jgi:hypothetical protein